MDVCCDLLVDTATAAAAGTRRELGVSAPPPRTFARLPEALRARLHPFALDVSLLDALENDVNDHPGGSRDVEDLLRATLRPDRPWAFVFDLRCEQIDEVFPVRDVDELIARLRENLRWDGDGRIGFLAHHEPDATTTPSPR